MIKHPKAKGTRRERQAQRELENEGYFVIRASASNDSGYFDLICFNENGIRCIQVKSNKIKRKDLEKIKKFKIKPKITKEIWIWKDYHGWTKMVV
ncbi:MAG: hypothetical protein ACTSX6_00195 [Candidatus Heimdallarchaeaceae archaeon]